MADQRKNPFIKSDSENLQNRKLQGTITETLRIIQQEEKEYFSQPKIKKLVEDMSSTSKKESKQPLISESFKASFADKTKKAVVTGVVALTVTSLASSPANAVEQLVLTHQNEDVNQNFNTVLMNEELEVQTLVTSTSDVQDVLELDVVGVVDPAIIAQEKAEKAQEEARIAAEAARVAEEKAAAERAAEEAQRNTNQQPIPQASGEGRSDIANAAAAQLGTTQDCTDLVQNALAAVGINATRTNGGYDFGTQASEYVNFGGTIVTGGYLPGDVLIWPGSHVAVYFGNGQIVHGGWQGTQTVMNDYMPSPNPIIVRF